MTTEQPQPTNEAAGGASAVERVVRPEEFPPVPDQLLWMFDAIDRKEATKMIHDYAQKAITWKPSAALHAAWGRAQQSEDKARRLEDENERLRGRLNVALEICRQWEPDDASPELRMALVNARA